MNSIIRRAKTKDVNQIVQVHEEAFRGFFLTTLGTNFLRVYYEACISHKDSIVLCAIDERGSICGFASGTTRSKGYYKKILLTNFLPFFLIIVNLILKRPKAIIRLILNLDKSRHPADIGDYAELLSIAINPEINGNGVGNSLLNRFEKDVTLSGGNKLALTTDYKNNERVINFYKKCGYQEFYKFVTYPNRIMYKLIKDL